MKLILHIGTHKTGTTAIQNFLFKNIRSLQKQNFLYPSSHTVGGGHHPMAWSLGVNNQNADSALDFKTIAQQWKNEFSKGKYDTLILSSEDFEFLENKKLISLYNEFNEFKISIIIYIRRQDEYFVSEYKQHVKMLNTAYNGDILSFFLKYNLDSRFNYFKLLERWSSVFHKANISVHLFQKEKLVNNDIVDDFCIKNAIDIDGFSRPNAKSNNISFGPTTTRLIQRANSNEEILEKPTNRQALINLLSETEIKSKRKTPLIDKEIANLIMNRYHASNLKLSKNYFNSDTNIFEGDSKYCNYREKSIISDLESLEEQIILLMNALQSKL